MESRHRGAIAVVEAGGRAVLVVGEVDRAVYPRSAVKALQALPLVESGVADRFRLSDEELALACASHGGEPEHVATAARMLGGLGLGQDVLACGTHWPLHQPSALALARGGGSASALHNNCSGKHAAFIGLACGLETDHRGYTEPGHPVQRAVAEVLASLTDSAIGDDNRAVDGCSVPTWAVPLRALALAFARFGTGHGMEPVRSRAAARLRLACAAHPWHVAGTGRFCTEVMGRLGARAFVKTGAEGVFCAALPEQGLGIAVKVDDGSGRAAEVVTAALLVRLMSPCDDTRAGLEPFVRPVLRNWNGITVGSLRPTEALSQ